jgi:hypothetical protein
MPPPEDPPVMLVLEQPTSAVAKPVISINRIDASFIFTSPE